MRFAFVAKHRSIWPVAWLCEALDVSRSGFHAWLTRSPSKRSPKTKKSHDNRGQAFSAVTGPMAQDGFGTMCWRKGLSCGLHRMNG